MEHFVSILKLKLTVSYWDARINLFQIRRIQMGEKKILSRIQHVTLTNFKNIGSGKIKFTDYGCNNDSIHGDIMGIYGQNGSGKTALVDALVLVKNIVIGNPLPKDIRNYIRIGWNQCTIEVGTYFSNEEVELKVEYICTIKAYSEEKVIISHEQLNASEYRNDSWTVKRPVFVYDYEDQEHVFTPIKTYEALQKADSQAKLKLLVIKALNSGDNDEGKSNQVGSILFAGRMGNLLKKNLDSSNLLIKAAKSFSWFCAANLMILENTDLSVVSTNCDTIPITARFQEKESVSYGYLSINILESTVVPETLFDEYESTISRINSVLPFLVPDVLLEIASVQKQLTKEGENGISFEIASIRNGQRLSLKYESAGIKKIICLLSQLIAVFNHDDVCLVIDELDSGVYEYLLGQMLSSVLEDAKGQLIFTSHNLHVLEVLPRSSLIFTTTNPENCYTSLVGVKPNNNLRDYYYRTIVIGGQSERMYNETNKYEMSFAFRNAESMFGDLRK